MLITMLARSAVGAKLTGYNTWLTGPRLAGETDGPEEFHLVIVDNGRSDILASEFQEVLRCIRCGACLNTCPAYRQIGGHGYGSVIANWWSVIFHYWWATMSLKNCRMLVLYVMRVTLSAQCVFHWRS